MTKFREVVDVFPREDRMRTPLKGVRVRLRTELRKLGVKHKFRTDILRVSANRPKPVIVVMSKEYWELPISEFEGMAVEFFIKAN